jgi:anti-sigma-K factor RskA
VAASFVGLLGWNVVLHRELASRRIPVAVEQLARLPDGRIVALIGTGTPRASARLYVAEDGRRGELAIAGLPTLPPERVYQLWFARPGGPPVSGGVFRVDVRGEALTVVAIPVALEPARAVAVTEEPAPGSPAPTGQHLLDRRI